MRGEMEKMGLDVFDANGEVADNYDSAISHILRSMRTRLQKDSDLRVKYNRIYSLCKM